MSRKLGSRLLTLVSSSLFLFVASSFFPPSAQGVTTPATGAAEKPGDFVIQLPWAGGVEHRVTQAYGSGLHQGTDRECCNNDFYALDVEMQLEEQVQPIAPGRVEFAGRAAGSWSSFGNMVYVDHLNGYQSVYTHLNSVAVATGQLVNAYTRLGGAGGSGGWGVHLHFALYREAKFYNTALGTGQYGGQSVVPEPFTNCVKDGGGSCENLAKGNRLRAGGAANLAPAWPSIPPVTRWPVALRWEPQGTGSVQIQVTPLNDDGPGVDVVLSDPGAVGGGVFSLQPPVMGAGNYVLLSGATYAWRYRMSTAPAQPAPESWSGWGPWSNPVWFQIPPPSGSTLSLVQPRFGSTVSTGTPTLQWVDEDQHNFYYEAQLSADPFFRTGPGAPAAVYWLLVHGGLTAPLQSWTVPDSWALPSGRYYFRVRQRVQATPAGEAEPGIPWSRISTFVVS